MSLSVVDVTLYCTLLLEQFVRTALLQRVLHFKCNSSAARRTIVFIKNMLFEIIAFVVFECL